MASKVTPVLVDPQKEQNYLDLADSGSSVYQPAQGSPDMLPGIVPGLLYLATQIGSMWYNSRQQDKQNEFQESLINKQNAYNSPTAQLNRLLAAGVPYNTAMSYMNGTVGSSTQPMSGQAAPYSPVQPTTLGDYIKLTQASDEHDLAQSQVRLNDANAYSLDPENPMNIAQRTLQQNQAVLAGKEVELKESQRVQTDEMVVLIQKQQMTEFWKSEKEFQDVNSYHRMLNANLQLMAAQTGKTEAECWGILQKTALDLRMEGVQRELFSSQSSNFRASARLSNAEAAIKEVKDGDIPAMARTILLQNLSQSQENDIRFFWNRPIFTWSKSDCKNFGSWSAAVMRMSTTEAYRNKRYSSMVPEYFPSKHRYRDESGKIWYY